ncbi:MAG: hypothetical protein AB1Z98_15565 [Nannocystaceae bacterium]
MNLLPTMAPSLLAAWSALPISVLVYLLLMYDARRKDSPAAEDTQLGLKTVAAVLIIVSTLMFAIGFQRFLHVMLTFDDFGDRMKGALPSVLVGGLGVIATGVMLFPKTNAEQFPKAKRLAAGMIALLSGIAMLPAVAMLLTQLLDWPSWDAVAEAASVTVDVVVIFGISFIALGKLSGMTMPELKSSGPPAQGPGQGYPPQQQPQQPQYAAQPQGQPYPGQPQPQYPQPGQAPQAQAPQAYPPQGQAPQGQPPPAQGWPQG